MSITRFHSPIIAGFREATRKTTFAASLNFTTSNWPTANRAIYVPWVAPADCEIESLIFNGVATGNYDLGLLDASFARLDHKGSTANVAGTNRWTPASPIAVDEDTLVYCALALSSGSSSVVQCSASLGATAGMIARMLGVYQEATALPIPAAATPVTPAANFVPCIGIELVGVPTVSG